MGMTLAEKILANKSQKGKVVPGEIVDAYPDAIMSHYATYRAVNVMRKIGVDELYDPDRIVIIIDHRVPARTVDNANQEKIARDFAKERNIKNFYDVHKGIAHLVMMENGHVLPGDLVVGTDSHSTIYGCMGALGCGIGFTECASVWIKGKLWMKVPESFKIILKGDFPKGVYAKDLILDFIGKVTANGCTYKSVEFHGDLTPRLSMSERMTLACMSMEMGVKAAFIPPDGVTLNYLKGRNNKEINLIQPDEDAVYAKEFFVDVDRLEPVVAAPHNADNIKKVTDVAGQPIHQAFVGSCANANFEDLRVAAEMLRGHKVHRDVRFMVAPSSQEVFLKATKAGFIQTLIEANVLVTNPGCSACADDGGALADGEICLASSTRNFLGRMGNRKSEVYLSSPATVAASAIRGVITDPREFVN
jgi:3-isopropylmalate/(R)-2-methylmalate dehydratase large subunit